MAISEYLFFRNLNNAEQGQSTLEFVLTLTLFLGFTFFIIQLGFAFAFGNYVQYATFMAARAYLSAGPSQGDQDSRARFVLGYMLKTSGFQTRTDKFPSIAKGSGGASADFPGLTLGAGGLYDPSADATLWMMGVQYKFSSKIIPLPLGVLPRAGSSPALNSLTLTSESWLGREPSDAECADSMRPENWRVDNGC